MMPSVNPNPPFTRCSLASGDTSASSAGSSLTTAGLSPCACATAAQAPMITVNRVAAETEIFFIKRPSNPILRKAGGIHEAIYSPAGQFPSTTEDLRNFSRTGNKPAAPPVMHVVTGPRADRLSHLIGGECHARQGRSQGFLEARRSGRRGVRLRARGRRRNRRPGEGRLLLRPALGYALGVPGTGRESRRRRHAAQGGRGGQRSADRARLHHVHGRSHAYDRR